MGAGRGQPSTMNLFCPIFSLLVCKHFQASNVLPGDAFVYGSTSILLLGECLVFHVPDLEAGGQVTSQGAHIPVWTFLDQTHEQCVHVLILRFYV